jgi:hypothetical protein
MHSIPTITETAIPQIISELSKLAPTTELATKKIEVIAQYLSENQIKLTQVGTTKSPNLVLQTQQVQGAIQNQTQYQIHLSLTDGVNIELLSVASKPQLSQHPLTEQQLARLLLLPPKYFASTLAPTANSVLAQSHNLPLPQLQAQVVQLSAQSSNVRLTEALLPNDSNTHKSAETRQFRITNISPQLDLVLQHPKLDKLNLHDKLQISLTPRGNNWQLTIQVDNQINAGFKNIQSQTNNAEEVKIQQVLTPAQSKEWLKAVLHTQTKQGPFALTGPIQPIVNRLQDTTQGNLITTLESGSVDKLWLTLNSPHGANLTTEQRPLAARIAVTQALAQAIQAFNLPKQAALEHLIQSLPNQPQINETSTGKVIDKRAEHHTSHTGNQTAAHTQPNQALPKETKQNSIIELISQLSDKAKLLVIEKAVGLILNQNKYAVPPSSALDSNQLGSARANSPNSLHPPIQPQASLPLISTGLTQVLSQLGESTRQLIVEKLVNLVNTEKTLSNKQNSGDAVVSQSASELTSGKETKPKGPIPITQQQTPDSVNILSLSQRLAALTAQVQAHPQGDSIINQALLNSSSQQSDVIKQLLRVAQANAETPASPLSQLQAHLSPSELDKNGQELPIKQAIAEGLQKISQTFEPGTQQDASRIRQLLNAPSFLVSAPQLAGQGASSGLVNGLVTLLQLSLGARLSKQRPQLTEHLSQSLSAIFARSTDTKPKISAKGLNDFSQVEQKHQILKELGRVLSSHQANKIGNADQLHQGQESFYYQLPTLFNGVFKQAELLIKREPHSQQQKNDKEFGSAYWHLTLKLTIGDIGQLLSKVKLRADSAELNFYASNNETKHQVMNYLPLLTRRLSSLGIEVSHTQCQLGKIPDSLNEQSYHAFQAKV